MKQIIVVAAIIRKGDKIFATQRGYGEWKDWWAHQCLPLLECMVYFMESVHYIYRFGRYLYLF